MSAEYNLPCWCGEGRTCAGVFHNEEGMALHCFKCGAHVLEVSEDFEDKLYLMNGTNISRMQNQKDTLPLLRGIVTDLPDRSIRKDTCGRYGVETLFENDLPVARMFPGHAPDGEMVAQKIKPLNKESKDSITCRGDWQKITLFGQKNFQVGGKYITITEGEEDCLAAYQMLRDASPKFEPTVVSLTNGADSAEKNLKANYEYINSFERVIICFDNDEPGKKNAEKAARLFPAKSQVVDLGTLTDGTSNGSLKDANDYLKANKAKEFVQAWWRAERYAPRGVKTFRSLWDSMTKEDSNQSVAFPWEGLNKKAFGMRTGEMMVVKAPPKIGKTAIVKELAYHIRSTTEYNVGLIMLEDTLKSIGLGMCALRMNKPIQRPDCEYTKEELAEAHDYLSEANRITVFDPEDERTVENIFNKIMFFVKANDCKYIFLDHASMLAYSSGDGDERKFLDKLFADLKALTTQLNIFLGVVVHVNDDGKTRGSRAPVQLCNLLLSINRDKLNDDETVRNTMEVIVEENRLTGDSGLACKLLYNKGTGRMEELDFDTEIELQKQREEKQELKELLI